MTDYSKLYDEYLYDCYIANQHLTDEDWQYYGREEHHIEIPDRDGGLLTPLNSQPLTLLQHWIAGVLQSEVLGKCCFACVPKGVLPLALDLLRTKWVAESGRLGGKAYAANTTHEQRSKVARKVRANHLANTTFEQRSESARKANASRTPEERSEITRKGIAKRTPEQLVEQGRRAAARRTPEQRSEASRKGHETRRLKRLGLI
jgi:general stress protein YciG